MMAAAIAPSTDYGQRDANKQRQGFTVVCYRPEPAQPGRRSPLGTAEIGLAVATMARSENRPRTAR
jgi:hypothetical protein